jgi:hypothetical protein
LAGYKPALRITKQRSAKLQNVVFISQNRHTADWDYPPQTLPVPHEDDELEPSENELPPAAGLEANVDIFFFTWLLPQAGQTTSSILLRLNTRSSKDLLHSVHTNS